MQHYFLSKTKIPENLPAEMQDAINNLKQSTDQKKCLHKAYKLMTTKYRGYRLKTYLNFFQIFIFDITKLWNRTGFIHCHNANYLMRILLVKSGFFKNSDIQNKWTLVWYFSPHQYLQIKLNNGSTINIDIWGSAYGVKFGNYAHGIH